LKKAASTSPAHYRESATHYKQTPALRSRDRQGAVFRLFQQPAKHHLYPELFDLKAHSSKAGLPPKPLT
ncbi:MAG: hypothetical protein WBW33_00535, partial [Bryobacteraceae bacterium]